MSRSDDKKGFLGSMKRRVEQSKYAYHALVVGITIVAVLLMVLPAIYMPEYAALGEAQDTEKKAPEDDSILNTTFGDLDSKGWLALAFIFMGFFLMIFDVVGADFAMNLVLLFMVVFKILPLQLAISGYANSGLLTVVVLFVVAQGFTATGGADYFIAKLLGNSNDVMLAQVRMCLIAATISSFINDTPVFLIMLPIVMTWVAKTQLNIRQFLIPLSYCCLLGGLNTTIGTSTNLVVTGQFNDRVLNPLSPYYQPGLSPIPLFGITPYGLPNVIWGIIYIIYTSPFLLAGGAGLRTFSRVGKALLLQKNRPSSSDPASAETVENGDFFIGLMVKPSSPAIGMTIEDAGLRHLEGVYLTSVRRQGRVLHAVGSEFIISSGDVLYFSGVPDSIDEISKRHHLIPYTHAIDVLNVHDVPNLSAAFGTDTISVPRADSGLMSPHHGDPKTPHTFGDSSVFDMPSPGSTSKGPLELVQATVKNKCDIDGKSIRDAMFRTRFHAAVVSIKRQGIPLEWSGEYIGEELLKGGDQLLLDVRPQFWTSAEVNDMFTDITRSGAVRSNNEFMISMQVTSLLSGVTVQKAGLRKLPNAFLVAIERESATMHAVDPEEVLQHGDILWFAGDASSFRFIRNTPGLVPLGEEHAARLEDVRHVERRLVQAVIARGSPLIGKTPREIKFRQHFNAAVVAVARKGERIREKPGEIELQASDILLLDCGPGFITKHKDSKYFSVILEMENTNPPRYFHTAICIVLIVAAFVLYAVNVLDILVGAGIAAATMLITGCLSPSQARHAIKWDIYMMIAGSFGVSAGLEVSGGAAAIANLIISIGKNAGGEGFIIAAIYIATTILSQIISNNSAAALVFPIAATISLNMGIDIYILSYTVMLGASAVFMSSFGYQTNLLALGAGGHSSRDFLKFGTPLQLLLAVVSIASLLAGSSYWPFVWLATGVVGIFALGLPQAVDIMSKVRNKRSKRY
jgi:di/tricarboxylate transporter